MYQKVIASYVWAGVSKFRHRDVKISVLKLWSEFQNLVKKAPNLFEFINNKENESPRVGVQRLR